MASHGSGLSTTFTAYDVPLSAVLKWPPGNFTHPEKRHWFIPYAATIQGITTLVIFARLWTRYGKRAGGLGIDDGLIIASFILASGVTGFGIYGVLKGGLDRHVWDVLPALASRAGLVGWITELFFLTSLCLCKVSVLLFFRRLIDRSYNKALSYAILGAIMFTIAYFFAFFFFLVFACTPVDAAWKSLNITWTGQYKCVSRKNVDLLNGILSVFSDVYSLAIPVIIVGKLSMPLNRKVMLYIVFCCGLIVVGAGIARTYFLTRMFTDPRRDLTSVGHDLLVWGLLEIQMALICASAPAMKGFFLKLSETVTSAGYGSKNGSGQRSRAYGRSNTKLNGGSDNYNLTPLTPSSNTEQWNEKPSLAWPGSELKPGPQVLTTTNIATPSPTFPTSYNDSSPLRQHSNRGRQKLDNSDRLERERQRDNEERARERERERRERGDYVQLDSSGIHVTQRWSVSSYDPYENDRKARRMF